MSRPTQIVIRQPTPPMTARNGSPPTHEAAADPAEQRGEDEGHRGQPDALDDRAGRAVGTSGVRTAAGASGTSEPGAPAPTPGSVTWTP